MNDIEIIRGEILQGLLQVDSSFYFTSFEGVYDKDERKLRVYFSAKNSKDEEVSGVNEYA